MKILCAIVLLLALISGGLGYVEYRQHIEITSVKTQVSDLTVVVNDQTQIILSDNKELSKVRNKEQAEQKILFDIVDFLSHLDIQKESSSGNGPRS